MKKNGLVKAGLAMAAAVVVMTGCGNSETATKTETTALPSMWTVSDPRPSPL